MALILCTVVIAFSVLFSSIYTERIEALANDLAYEFNSLSSSAGATFKDIELFAAHVGAGVKIKAAGGIASLEDAEKFLELGADRLGTSRIIKLMKNEEANGY